MRQLYTELSRSPAPRCEQGGHQVTEEVIKKPQQHFAHDCDQEEQGGSTKSLDSLFQFMLPLGFNLNWDPDWLSDSVRESKSVTLEKRAPEEAN